MDDDRSLDWLQCSICQKKTKEKLRSSVQGYGTLAELLPQFDRNNALDFDLNRLITEGLTLRNSLEKNNALYHHTCAAKYNQQKLDRAIKKFNRIPDPHHEADVQSPPCKRRSEGAQIHSTRDFVCCFCSQSDIESNLHAAGTLHATYSRTDISHVDQLTERWRSMAVVIGNDNLLRSLSAGDVAANEIFYHGQCLKNFHNAFRKAQGSETITDLDNYTDWIKVSSLNKLFYHMCGIEQKEPGTVFEVKVLEEMYMDLLRYHCVKYQSHVTRFAEILLEKNSELEKRNVGRKVVIYFKRTADVLFKEVISEPSSFLRSLRDVVIPLRNAMSAVENTFDGNFPQSCQRQAVPIELLTLISLIIDGLNIDNTQFSQASLTISQLILANFKQSSRSSKAQYSRNIRCRETPVQIYTSLKLYSSIRSRNLIDHLFKLGICSSYDRILEITKSLSDNMTSQYVRDGAFCPSNLKKNVFTMMAKDNCDLNAASSTATMHYHGTSITVMQCPNESDTSENITEPIIPIPANSRTKKVVSLPSSYIEPKPVYLSKGKLFLPKQDEVCTVYDSNDIFDIEKTKEIEWIDEQTNRQLKGSVLHSWSKHHAEKQRTKLGENGINAILPLIPKPVHTLETQFHCMQIAKQTISLLNPGQTPVDVCDQPVYALTKEIQVRKPELFGEDKYFSLLGGLHLEHCLLTIHGELVKGSGLYEVLNSNNLSIIGTGAVVNANHIKQARYCLQVSICSIYAKLTEARDKSGSKLSPIEWLKEQKSSNQMCFYWDIILNLQIEILIFIRSIRESNFKLYVLSLKNAMKWFFAMDHHNYARWGSVHLMDLIQLRKNCPDIYDEFDKGNFSFQKTNHQFSKMAPDQLHEQNNEVIKGTSGATHLLNRQERSGLERWELCGHEIARLLSEFESDMGGSVGAISPQKHHEDTVAFQKRFSDDVDKVQAGMIANPFMLGTMTKISNTNTTFPDKVFEDMCVLAETGESQFKDFWTERLVTATKALDVPIKKNSFLTPGRSEEQKEEKQKQLVYSNEILNKLRSAADNRHEMVSRLFEGELFGVAQSLAKTSVSLYHGSKSEILKKFASKQDHKATNTTAAVVDISLIIKGLNTAHCETFNDFAMALYSKVSNEFKEYKRVDLIFDRYFRGSLKETLREERGVGSRILFEDCTALPPKFHSDFLKNSENKDELGKYLAKKFLELHSNTQQILVATYEQSILTNVDEVFNEVNISHCTSEEADQRIIRHVLNLSRYADYESILVCTHDTDVFMLLLANSQPTNGINLVCQFGFGSEKKYFSINEIAQTVGEHKCKALPFFHAFSDCDTVSGFYGHSKAKLWDAWMEHDEEGQLTEVFKSLSDKPKEITEYHLGILETFIKKVYYPRSEIFTTLDAERLQQFLRQADPKLRLLPPSRNGLREHVKRAALQGGWIWSEARTDVEFQDPELWGWQWSKNRYVPRWQSEIEDAVDIYGVCITCSCRKAICKNCKCAKAQLKCLPFCGCRRTCEAET